MLKKLFYLLLIFLDKILTQIYFKFILNILGDFGIKNFFQSLKENKNN